MARPRKEQELDIARRAVEETIRLLAERGDFDVPLSDVAQAVGCNAAAMFPSLHPDDGDRTVEGIVDEEQLHFPLVDGWLR